MKVQKCIFTLLAVLVVFHSVFSQQKVGNNNCRIPYDSRFERKGILYVLLDEQYFKPQELKSLFLCLSQKRPHLAFLKIIALSDKENLDVAIKSFTKDLTPPLIPPPDLVFPSDWKPQPSQPLGYYRAIYYRYKNEYFEYNPNPQELKMLTIVLRSRRLKGQ